MMTPDEATNRLVEVTRLLRGFSKPPMAWFVERDGTGVDPIVEAWKKCDKPKVMYELAFSLRDGRTARGNEVCLWFTWYDEKKCNTCFVNVRARGWIGGWRRKLHEPNRSCPSCCTFIRRSIRKPITLNELMELHREHA
jgi:hypothetical protein